MDFSIQVNAIWMELSINILRGHTHKLKFLNYDVFLSLKIVLTTAKSVDTDEMHILWHFIWVFTVCQSTCLGGFSIQRVKWF